jgi:6-pyruvoyltetrahydropterin/6-carboxytetrahydropterin synthase
MSTLLQLEIDFTFEAAHRLPNVAPDHKCARLHGHSFRCTVSVEGPLDEHKGWVMDYADIKAAIEPLRLQLDHNYLNEISGLSNPTSEHLARWIWLRLTTVLPGLESVTVAETCNARCIYRGETRA